MNDSAMSLYTAPVPVPSPEAPKAPEIIVLARRGGSGRSGSKMSAADTGSSASIINEGIKGGFSTAAGIRDCGELPEEYQQNCVVKESVSGTLGTVSSGLLSVGEATGNPFALVAGVTLSIGNELFGWFMPDTPSLEDIERQRQ